jgi:hypothetical protein
MKEILGVADDPPARRRWFHDEFFDLFVWECEGEVTLFQLCYGLDSAERALVWDKQRGLFLDGAATGGPDSEEVVARFQSVAAALPDAIRRAVTPRVREFAEKRRAITSRRRRFRRETWQR